MSPTEPTNAELDQEIKAIDNRVLTLEDWKRDEDAYRAAVARVKAEEATDRNRRASDSETKKRTEIMKQVGIILALITAILYAYASTHGVKT